MVDQRRVKRMRCQEGPGFCKLKTGQIGQILAPSGRDQPILCDYHRCKSVEEGESLEAHQESLIECSVSARRARLDGVRLVFHDFEIIARAYRYRGNVSRFIGL
jgi:hypothetical protein